MKNRSKRFLSAFLALLFVFSSLSVNSFADNDPDILAEIVTDEPVTDDTAVYTEDYIPEGEDDSIVLDEAGRYVYTGTIDPYYPAETELNVGRGVSEPERVLEARAYSFASEDYSKASATESFRDALVRKDTTFTVVYSLESTGEVTSEMIDEEFLSVIEMACEHNISSPALGDYLRYNIYSFRAGYSVYPEDDTNYLALNFTMQYYTTLDQETAVDSVIPSILSGLALEGKSELDKVKAIYGWLCDNVTYDYDLKDISHSAYAALITHDAVCQGYATAFYRLCLESGVEARYISSDALNHAWDIVRLGPVYYYVDSTWDAGCAPDEYDYFLIGSENWVSPKRPGVSKHDLGKQFERTGFSIDNIVSESDYDGVLPTSGICGANGSNARWEFDAEQKSLTITGTGAMKDYSYAGIAPWAAYASAVKDIYIGSGITKIGRNAFFSCSNAETLYLEPGLTFIGANAFASLDVIYFNGCEGFLNRITINSPNSAIANAPCQIKKHDYSIVKVIAPGCTVGGCTRHSCACGDYFDDTQTAAIGHNYVGNYCANCHQHIPTIRFSSAPRSVRVGGSTVFRVTTQYAPSDARVIWSCSDNTVSLSPSGSSCTVVGKSAGTAVITATLVNSDGTPIVQSGISVSSSVNITNSSGGISSVVSMLTSLFELFNPLNFLSRIFSLFR